MSYLRMYILSGMSFAGKSVLAREISRAKDVEIVDPDEVAHEHGLGLHGEFLSDAVWRALHAEAENRARCLLRLGKSVIYDTTAFNREQRDHLREIASTCGAIPIVIIVSIERAEAFSRWQENTISKQRAQVHLDDFQMCADAFIFPGKMKNILFITLVKRFRSGSKIISTKISVDFIFPIRPGSSRRSATRAAVPRLPTSDQATLRCG